MLKIEMGKRKAPSTSQSSYYYEGCYTTYNISSQTTTVWKSKKTDDDGTYYVDFTFSSNNSPYVFSVYSNGIGFQYNSTSGSGRTTYLRTIVNPSSSSIVNSKSQDYSLVGFSYFQDGNVNYFPNAAAANNVVFFNVDTETYTLTSNYGSDLSRQAIVKNGNNIYCLGCGTNNAIYSLTSYTWTALPSYGSIGLGSGYVFKNNICYFRNNNQIIAFNLNTNTFTVTNTIDGSTSTAKTFVGWANYGNNYLYCPQKSTGTTNGLYRFTVAGTAGSTDTVYIITGGNKNYANIVSGTSGAASVPIQGVYTMVNGTLTPFADAYVSTGGAWSKVVY